MMYLIFFNDIVIILRGSIMFIKAIVLTVWDPILKCHAVT